MAFKQWFNHYSTVMQRFFKKYKRELKQASFGVLLGFSCLFVTKRLLNPPVVYFAKVIVERYNAAEANVLKETPVDVITLKKAKVKMRIDALATVRSENFVDIKTPKMNMRVQNILYQEGEEVTEGQPLIQFDDTEAHARFEEANARAQFTKAEYDRAKYLFSKDAASEGEVQDKKGEYEKAKGALEEAKASFGSMLVKAPISGRAGIIENATIGSLVSPDRTIMSIANDQNEVKVTFKVPVRHINDFKLGQAVIFKIEAFENQTFEGHVTAIDSKVNESDILVQALITNTENKLKSGMIGHAQILTDIEKDGYIVPMSSLVKKDENYYVPVVERDKIANKLVIKGPELEDKTAEILTGLKDGDMVVQNASASFVDGLKVLVAKLNGEVITPAVIAQKSWKMFSFSFKSLRLMARYILERHQLVKEKYAIHVNALHVNKRTVYKKLNALGTIRSPQFIELKSHIRDQKIKAIKFAEGDHVKEGDILIEFENAEVVGEYNKNKGDFEAKKARFERSKKLYAEKAETQLEFDKVKAEYEIAKAHLNAVKFKLANLTIRAPFSGKIGILQKVNVGSLPIQDRPLVSIVNDEKVYVYAKVPIKYLNTIGLGQGITLTLGSQKKDLLEGTIISIDSKVDESTQTILVKIELPGEHANLKSGTIMPISIITDTIEDAIAVPEESCFGMSRDKDYMVGIKNGKTIRYIVEKDFEFSEGSKVYWVIKKGLKEEDVFVSEIGSNIRIGYPVVIEMMNGKHHANNEKAGQ